MKFIPRFLRVIEEIADHGNVATTTIQETSYAARKLNEGEFININEEIGWDEKEEDVPEEVTPAKIFTLKELSEIFYNVKSTRDKMLEIDPNLKKG